MDEPFPSLAAADFTRRDEREWPAVGLELARGRGWLETALEPGDPWADVLGVLRAIGYHDLTLGRIVEGHLNGLQLVRTFGDPAQWQALKEKAGSGGLSAIWDSELPGQGVVLTEVDRHTVRLHGSKAFASAAGRAVVPIVTATWGAGSASKGERQMVILDSEADGVQIGQAGLELLGVQATETRSIVFEKVDLPRSHLVGQPGDYLRDPWLTVGAARFLALWVGAMERLLDLVRDNYQKTGSPARTASDQRAARIGACVWQARALLDTLDGALSRLMPEAFLAGTAPTALAAAPMAARREWATESLCAQTLCARHAIETLAHQAMALTEQEIGLKGMVKGHPLARLVRDLSVYLRQPATDTALDRSGGYILAGSPGHFSGELWEPERAFATTSRFLQDTPLDVGRPRKVKAEFVHQFGRTVLVAPHPDDETLGAGGTLALMHDAGLPVKVVFLTDGEDSHPPSPERSRAELGQIRRGEAVEACRCLGVSDVAFCQFPDGRMPAEGADDFEDAVSRLEAIIGDFDPHTILTTWRRDRHGDHRAASQLCQTLIDRRSGRNTPRLIEFPVWVWEARSPAEAPREDEVDAVSILLDENAFSEKCRALECHASQLGREGFAGDRGFRLRPRHLDRFAGGREVFLLPKRVAHDSVQTGFFEEKYQEVADPWSYETSAYEQAKYRHLLTLLPEANAAGSILELGCSIGVLSALLAEKARSLTAMDCSPVALERARERLRDHPRVEFVEGALPRDFPAGTFDAVIVSEVGYYLNVGDLALVADRAIAALNPGASLILVHWTVYVETYPQTGDEVHEQLDRMAERAGLLHGSSGRKTWYRWDVWTRPR